MKDVSTDSEVHLDFKTANNYLKTFNCKTRNVVYCITCEQCKLQYIGQTTRSLDERVREHIGYIRNLHTNQPTGEHVKLPGHELYHLKVNVLEKV